MSKIVLNNVADLTQSSTAQTTINTNSATVQTAFDNTLSRDGTSPNQMGAALDMNGFQILNLTTPATVNSPARLVDVTTNPTIVVPPTGTSGHTVPFLDGTNTWSAVQTFPNNSITNAELAQMPTLTIKGNNTGSTGNALDLTAAQVNTLLGGSASLGGNNTWTGTNTFTNTVTLPSNTAIPNTINKVIVQTFTSSGTYTPSAGMLYCHVTLVGGGGGGGGTPASGAGQSAAGGGGAAGGQAYGVFTAATIGASKAVTIGGQGIGSAGVAGTNGGNSTFGALLTANGGTGGPLGILSTTSTISGGANGGSASGGYLNITGATGGDGWGFTGGGIVLASGGTGGPGLGGGFATVAMTPSTALAGVGASVSGGGGGGACAGASQGQIGGGNGSGGICIVIEYTT